MFRNRRLWEGFSAPGRRIVMVRSGNCYYDGFFGAYPSCLLLINQLNSDIGLFRNLDSSNYDEATGRARCGFEDDTSREASIPVCPHVESAVLIGAELKHDNLKFKV